MGFLHRIKAALVGICFLVLALSRAAADPWGERDLEKGFADWLGADWIMQDGGSPGTVFTAEEGFEQELAVINKAAEELAEYDEDVASEKLAAAEELAGGASFVWTRRSKRRRCSSLQNITFSVPAITRIPKT